MPPRSRLLLRSASFVLATLLVASGTVVVWVQAVGAHSFLVSPSPSQGQRLSSAPDSVVLEFSEPVDLDTVLLGLHLPSGELVDDLVPELVRDGRAVRARVGSLEETVYVVSWQALSAVDGHGSSSAPSAGPSPAVNNHVPSNHQPWPMIAVVAAAAAELQTLRNGQTAHVPEDDRG